MWMPYIIRWAKEQSRVSLYVSIYLAYEPRCNLWIILDCVLAAFDPSLRQTPVNLCILRCSTIVHQSEDHRHPLRVSLLRSNLTFRVGTYHINYRLKCHPAHQYLKMIRKKSTGYTIPWLQKTRTVTITSHDYINMFEPIIDIIDIKDLHHQLLWFESRKWPLYLVLTPSAISGPNRLSCPKLIPLVETILQGSAGLNA